MSARLLARQARRADVEPSEAALEAATLAYGRNEVLDAAIEAAYRAEFGEEI